MTLGINIIYHDYDKDADIQSMVYCVDAKRDRFLIVNEHKQFIWVPTSDCELDNKYSI